jgi:hypothetical protein
MTSHIQLRKVKDNETDSLVNYYVNYAPNYIYTTLGQSSHLI